MAQIVAGFGVAHSPQLSMTAAMWRPHGEMDVSSGRLAGLTPSGRSPDELAAELTDEVTTARYERCQVAMDHVFDRVRALDPDVILIVGDDEKELFRDDIIAGCCVFIGDELYDLPPGPQMYPVTMREAYQYYHAPEPEPYVIAGHLGRHLVAIMNDDGVDIARSSVQPKDRSIGHAFTFVRRRILHNDPRPMLPFFLNTYYPPNQPTPNRCVQIGRSLRTALDSWDADQRVVLIASGGLSHPIIDEELDRLVLDSLAAADFDTLAGLDVATLVEGTSEIRNWITVGAALDGLTMRVVDYIPAYRSLAGSGCGMGFTEWTPDGSRQ